MQMQGPYYSMGLQGDGLSLAPPQQQLLGWEEIVATGCAPASPIPAPSSDASASRSAARSYAIPGPPLPLGPYIYTIH
jgi:hypothetical protein